MGYKTIGIQITPEHFDRSIADREQLLKEPSYDSLYNLIIPC